MRTRRPRESFGQCSHVWHDQSEGPHSVMGMSADGFATIVNLLSRLEVLALVQGGLAIVELNIVNV